MEHCGPEEAVDELAELGRDPTWKQRGLIRRPELYVHASDPSPADWRALAAQPAKGSPKTAQEHKRRMNGRHLPPQLIRPLLPCRLWLPPSPR
jgi:hypothetical protein